MLRVLAVAIALSSLACLDKTPPTLAPDAVDANLKWFWINGNTADDATLLDAAEKLGASGKADSRTTPFKGQARERLATEDIANTGLTDTDPSTARGLIIVNLFDCTLDKLQAILIAQDQMSQYTDVYKSYARSYTSEADAFTSGTKNTLTWDVDVKAALPVDDTYSSLIRGGIRRVPAPADGATKGPFLVTRTWLTAPATFAPTSTSYFKQDYQIEVFWEQSPGHIFHGYGMWRDIKAVGLTFEDNGFLNIVLDNLVAWDTKTAELCKKP